MANQNHTLHCEYYATYKGPELLSAWIDQKIDVFPAVSKLYGPNFNWCHKLHLARAIFTNEPKGETLIMRFRSFDSETYHEVKFRFQNIDDILNPPMFMPLPDDFLN